MVIVDKMHPFAAQRDMFLFLNMGDSIFQRMISNPNNAAIVVVIAKWQILPSISDDG